jgi:gliding motility-associated-like protein
LKKGKKYQFYLGFFLLIILFFVANRNQVWANEFPKTAIQFTENIGQWDKNVLFKADVPIGNIFIENNTITYLFVDKESTHKMQHGEKVDKVKFHSVKVHIIGANNNPKVLKDLKSSEYYNFFIGDQSRWRSNVYAYKKITLSEIYPGTDLEILAQGDGVKINFILQPGADISKIKLKYEGADKLQLKENGLHIETSLGEIIEENPISFQTINNVQEIIPTDYILSGDLVQFKPSKYNPSYPIIVDPAVIFGTYMGSPADNFGFAASFDKYGNAYGAGTVYAANFPYTAGAFDVSFNGGSGADGEYARDVFIAKFNPTGSALMFGSFIGGSDNEQPHSVTVASDSFNTSNDILIFGTTNSVNFPVTNSSFDKTHNGNSDLFVLRLNNAGNNLIASTYIGGSEDDGINGDAHKPFWMQSHQLPYNYADWFRGEVILDFSGNVYVSTCTKSTQNQGIPLINASQASFGGGIQDGYFLKLNGSLSTILFSTFVGGSGDESVHSVCINNLNEPIIAGGTTSNNMQFGTSSFPYSGGVDGFVGKYSSSGLKQKIIYVGTSAYDQAFFVQTDLQNNIYTMGQTSGNMPLSPNVYGISNAKQFILKFNSSLTTLVLSTTFGKASSSMPSLSPSAFLVDICGRVYVSGWGGGTNNSYHNGMDHVFGMPTTPDAFQKTSDGSDFYLMVLAPDFKSLLYASFYGGSQSQEHVDGGTSHFDKSGVVYQAVCAGCGGLSDFPTTPTAYSRLNPGKRAYDTNQGGCNLGLFKFDMRTYVSPPVFRDTVLTVYAGKNLNFPFRITDAGGDKMTVTFESDILTRPIGAANINITKDLPGEIEGYLDWTSLCEDFGSDTFVINLTINDGACPIPNEVKRTIKIVLISDPIEPPYPNCFKVVDDQTLNVNWFGITPNSDFLNYQIFRSENGGKMKLIDSVSNVLITNYVDFHTPFNLDINYCYQLLSLNSCRLPGDSSRIICSLIKGDSIDANSFTGLNTEFFELHAYDTFNGRFFVNSKDPLDSVFIKIGGNIIGKPNAITSTKDGIGLGFAGLIWIPTCNEIGSDTIEFQIQVRDNSCPQFRIGYKTIKFIIIPQEQAITGNPYCPKKLTSDSVLVEWGAWNKKPLTEFLYLLRIENGMVSKIATFNDLNTTFYIDNYAINPNSKICYSLTTSDYCHYFGDTSIESCIKNNVTFAPNLDIYTATVVNDKSIELIWEPAEADSFWRYEVWKRKGRFGSNFEMVDEKRALADTVFEDKDVNVDEASYCYKLVNVDLCGNVSVNNKEVCTILLKGNAEPFVNKVNWLPYDYWNLGINKYELLKTEPQLYENSILYSKTDKPLIYSDNSLNYDNGLYQYTILAYENIFGNNQTSRSNTIDLIQLPIVYCPNAYTENGDGLNDEFLTLPVFVKDFHLQIYNRWGERIFETRNKKEGFNGKYRGNEIQNDVYFYLVSYTGWDSSLHTLKGNFTILK